MIKRIQTMIIITVVFCLLLCSCSTEKQVEKTVPEPNISQIRLICELSTLECYYHNVAKSVKKEGRVGGILMKRIESFGLNIQA
ncbi:MAG: hypothetical protein Q4E53_06985 [Eubacteriales bacterium]|nr:hypothetical protein [Eubacteriales bacterium]